MSGDTDATGRQLIHCRQVECLGYLRADGLWDIEGRLSDSKTHSVPLNSGRYLEAGQDYHGMLIRLTVDDEFIIHQVDVQMPSVPTSECSGAAAAYAKLIGVRIGPGFSRRIKELFGGPGGCTHLTELLLPIATTAYQTIPMGRAMVAPRNAEDTQAYARATGTLVNTCFALRTDGPIAINMNKTE